MDFNGIQEGERVLYQFKPHPLYKGILYGRAVLATAAFAAAIWGFREQVPFLFEHRWLWYRIVVFIALAASCWWAWQVYRKANTIITDRRLVRLSAGFPTFTRKRSLFWNVVAKVKGIRKGIILEYMKIGLLEAQPRITPFGNLHIDWVYYFEDLANYMDKIIFLAENDPDALKDIKPFVTKPKGQRDEEPTLIQSDHLKLIENKRSVDI